MEHRTRRSPLLSRILDLIEAEALQTRVWFNLLGYDFQVLLQTYLEMLFAKPTPL